MENILEKIEEIRKEKGVKQEVLAKCLEVKQPAYSNSIRREKDIRWSDLLRICNALDMDVVDVITYPVKYAPITEQCEQCKKKDEIIQNLNDYIRVLKKNK